MNYREMRSSRQKKGEKNGRGWAQRLSKSNPTEIEALTLKNFFQLKFLKMSKKFFF